MPEGGFTEHALPWIYATGALLLVVSVPTILFAVRAQRLARERARDRHQRARCCHCGVYELANTLLAVVVPLHALISLLEAMLLVARSPAEQFIVLRLPIVLQTWIATLVSYYLLLVHLRGRLRAQKLRRARVILITLVVLEGASYLLVETLCTRQPLVLYSAPLVVDPIEAVHFVVLAVLLRRLYANFPLGSAAERARHAFRVVIYHSMLSLAWLARVLYLIACILVQIGVVDINEYDPFLAYDFVFFSVPTALIYLLLTLYIRPRRGDVVMVSDGRGRSMSQRAYKAAFSDEFWQETPRDAITRPLRLSTVLSGASAAAIAGSRSARVGDVDGQPFVSHRDEMSPADPDADLESAADTAEAAAAAADAALQP